MGAARCYFKPENYHGKWKPGCGFAIHRTVPTPAFFLVTVPMSLIPLSLSLRLSRRISLRSVVVVGFVLAILPLLTGIVSAVLAVDQLSVLSQQTVYRVAQQTRSSRLLLEKLAERERRGKQFLVLNDTATRDAYTESHRQFAEIADSLEQMADTGHLVKTLEQLVAAENEIFIALTAPPPQSPDPGAPPGKGKKKPESFDQQRLKQATADFAELHAKARQAAQDYADFVDTEAADLTERSKQLQRHLLSQTTLLAPASLLIIAFFLFVIGRPIRLIDHAIRRLGAGQLNRPIKVTGSRDMEYLGERLDWLRIRLHDLEIAKQRFMRNVSHEIKTPLANLKEGTDLLADEVVGKLSPEQREIAQILTSNVQKLEALIANLINYGQANANQGGLKLETVDFRGIAAAVIEDQQLRLRSKSLTVKAALRPVQLTGNAEQLRTIIDNLLSNAVKYSPPEGEIRISLREIGGHMELEVEDQGPGIDPDERSQVFEPLFQGRAARKYGISGTGLGLAIVAECVASHHGKVEALEPREGRGGARFRVQIPLAQESQ
ncbi:MAG: HAMP domain-containing histidine kinase [Methylococcaceae bacterium]|nr:HAMP domain-containing histidine kinase [Methylococcaceae bacterium]